MATVVALLLLAILLKVCIDVLHCTENLLLYIHTTLFALQVRQCVHGQCSLLVPLLHGGPADEHHLLLLRHLEVKRTLEWMIRDIY